MPVFDQQLSPELVAKLQELAEVKSKAPQADAVAAMAMMGQDAAKKLAAPPQSAPQAAPAPRPKPKQPKPRKDTEVWASLISKGGIPMSQSGIGVPQGALPWAVVPEKLRSAYQQGGFPVMTGIDLNAPYDAAELNALIEWQAAHEASKPELSADVKEALLKKHGGR